MNILFGYGGKLYRVGYEAYSLNRIVLPDGTVLESKDGWFESMPPTPNGPLTTVQHLFGNLTPNEIAQHLNGVVAEEIT